jgi:IrrE N-terminal-like domain
MDHNLTSSTCAPRQSLRGIPSPIRLSEYVFAQSECHRNPPIDVHSLAADFGISRIEIRPSLKTVGQLDVVDEELCILLPPGTSEQRHRFTIAHELGHYLLAVECGFPLSRQVGDRQVEVYCNSFASQLLIPHWWLHENWADAPVCLDTVQAVAARTQTNQASAALALSRSLGSWRALFMLWRRYKNSWYAPTCIRPSGMQVRRVEATTRTGEVLEGAIRSRTRSHRVPMFVDGEVVTIDCEVAPVGRGVAVLAHTT